MKKVVLLSVILVVCFNTSIAQEVKTFKNYAGIKAGLAFPMGQYVSDNYKIGGQFDFNFGYLFSENIGIATLLFYTFFPKKGDSSGSVGLGGFMVGPLFAITSELSKVGFDVRPSIGFGTGSGINTPYSASSGAITITAGLGASVRWNCRRELSLSGNVDLFYGSPKSVNLSSFAISIGVHRRF